MTKSDNPARWPAALRLHEAAEYSGLSVDTFKEVCPVKPIEFTESTRGDRYLRASLDAWLSSLEVTRPSQPVRRRLGELLHRAADVEHPAVVAPPQAREKPRRPSSSGWGFSVDVQDPATIEQVRAMGLTVLEDGEWEALVKNSPMRKRETAALGGYSRAHGEPVDVKGSGWQVSRRLVARGYIELARSRDDGRMSLFRITPAGEAEWQRIAGSSSGRLKAEK